MTNFNFYFFFEFFHVKFFLKEKSFFTIFEFLQIFQTKNSFFFINCLIGIESKNSLAIKIVGFLLNLIYI